MTTKTDDNGHYSFIKLGRGEHTFQVSAPGRPTKETVVVIPSDNYNIEL